MNEEQMEEQVNDTDADMNVEPSALDATSEESTTPDAASEAESEADAEPTDIEEAAEDESEAPEPELEADADTEADAEADDEDAEVEVEADTDAPEPEPAMEAAADIEADVEVSDEDVEVEVEADAEAPEPEPVAIVETEETETEEVVEAEEAVPDDDRKWYVVHCYSGYENKVRHAIEQRIETMDMQDKIFDVVVPTEEEIEVRDGKRRTVERRVFPGYILVQMLMGEDSWYVVRNTPGVTGFVGMGNEPTPLRPEEVSQIIKRMEAEAPKIKLTFREGQKIRIIDGPFNDFIGTVAEIDMNKGKVRAMVNFFGRDTPVELDFLQVEKA